MGDRDKNADHVGKRTRRRGVTTTNARMGREGKAATTGSRIRRTKQRKSRHSSRGTAAYERQRRHHQNSMFDDDDDDDSSSNNSGNNYSNVSNGRDNLQVFHDANMIFQMEERDDPLSSDDSHISNRGSNNNSNNQKSYQRQTDVTDKNAKSLMTLNYYEAMMEAEMAENAIDAAIDSAVIDLTGFSCDCSMLKDHPLVRHYLRAKEAWFPENATAKMPRASRLSNVEVREREKWMRFNLDLMNVQNNMIMTAQETPPFTLTRRVAQKIRRLPKKDVTLYIKLDEEIPKNSCTAYQVDMAKFEKGERTKLFRYFRICSLPTDDPSRRMKMDAIMRTVASACLHPYTTAQGGALLPNPNEKQQQQQQQAFRPTRILLDEEHDVNIEQLQRMLQSTLGIPECQLVDPLLRELHEDSDLDFFHDEDDTPQEIDTVPDETATEQEEVREGVEETLATNTNNSMDPITSMLSVEDDWGVRDMFDDYDDDSLLEIGSLLSSDKKTSGVCGETAPGCSPMMCFQPLMGGEEEEEEEEPTEAAW